MPRLTLGTNTTKSHVCFALLRAEEPATCPAFAILKTSRLAIAGTRPTILVTQLRAVFDSWKGEFGGFNVAVCSCSSGPRGSSIEAIKAEALVEFSCDQHGLEFEGVHPAGFRKSLGCDQGVKWQQQARELFNADGSITHFTSGIDSAAAAAFRALGLRPPDEV